jgi:hypothetical protein
MPDIRLRESRFAPTRRTLLGATAAVAAMGLTNLRAFSRGAQLHTVQAGDIPARFLTRGGDAWRGTLYDNRRAFEKVVALTIEAGSISSAEDPVPVATLEMECPPFRSWRHSTLRLAWVNDAANLIGLHEITSEASRCQGIGDSCCYPYKLVVTAQFIDASTMRFASIEGPSMGWLTR